MYFQFATPFRTKIFVQFGIHNKRYRNNNIGDNRSLQDSSKTPEMSKIIR